MKQTTVDVKILKAILVEKEGSESNIQLGEPPFQSYYDLQFQIGFAKYRKIISVRSWVDYFKEKKNAAP